MWRIDVQVIFLCVVLPPAGSYAVKHIYVGPHAADFASADLCVNLLLTLCGFFPGVVHALYLFARHKGWTRPLDGAIAGALLRLEAAAAAALRALLPAWRRWLAPARQQQRAHRE